MEDEVKTAFQDLRVSVGRLLERAATYSQTDSLETYAKAVTSALGSVSELVKQAHAPPSPEATLRLEIEQLTAELKVQKQLIALSGFEPAPSA